MAFVLPARIILVEYGGNNNIMFGKLTDEILELLWKLREEGSSSIRNVMDRIEITRYSKI